VRLDSAALLSRARVPGEPATPGPACEIHRFRRRHPSPPAWRRRPAVDRTAAPPRRRRLTAAKGYRGRPRRRTALDWRPDRGAALLGRFATGDSRAQLQTGPALRRATL